MMTVDEITTLVGVLTLVVGVTTFIVTERDKRRRAMTAVLRNWQGDTIAYIVDQSGSAGIGFSEIKSTYIDNSNQHKDGRVPTNMLQDEEIRRTLYDLQSKGIVYRMENDHYIYNRREAPEAQQKRMNEFSNNMTDKMKSIVGDLQTRQEEMQKALMARLAQELGNVSGIMEGIQAKQISYEGSQEVYRIIQQAALETAARDPNRYTTEQLAIDIMDRTKADRVIVMIQIISLIQNGILAVDGEGKTSIRLFPLREPVQPTVR